ncbi:hypothetical protein SLA2020_112610 [Shorea laevis]
MTVSIELRRRSGGCRAAIFLFFCVVFIFAGLSNFHFTVHGEKVNHQTHHYYLPRKARVLMDSTTVSFHAPPPTSGDPAEAEGPPDTVYGDDKRIIHTGPNPLHN